LNQEERNNNFVEFENLFAWEGCKIRERSEREIDRDRERRSAACKMCH
jgi:hypothetical protein